MIFWGRGFGRPKNKRLWKGQKKEEDVGRFWSSFSDSPQCEVHLAMFASCSVGDLAKCRRHGKVDLRNSWNSGTWQNLQSHLCKIHTWAWDGLGFRVRVSHAYIHTYIHTYIHAYIHTHTPCNSHPSLNFLPFLTSS